jgi:hypothetical protein
MAQKGALKNRKEKNSTREYSRRRGRGGQNTEHRCMMHADTVHPKMSLCARTSNMEIAKTKDKIPEEERSAKKMGGKAGERM